MSTEERNQILHITCDTDLLDAAIQPYSEAGWFLTHVHHPDYREGVKEWHLFFQRVSA